MHLAIARRHAAHPDDWPFAPRFDPLRRWYHRLAEEPGAEIWLLTWLPGQETELHDHGGSAGAFVVVRGQLVEHTIDRSSTWDSASIEVNPSVRPANDDEVQVVGTVTWLDPAPAAGRPAARVVVSPAGRSVLVDGVPVELTRVEFDLLHFLASHPRRAFSRAQLLQSVWGYSHAGHRTVDVHVRRIRAKLGDRPLVTTIRSIGYRLADDADVAVASP